MFTSPLEVKKREEGGGKGSTGRRGVEHMNPPSPTLGEQTGPSSLEQEFPHPASGPSTSAPAAHSFLASSHAPQTPQASGQNSSHSCSRYRERSKGLLAAGAAGLPGIWA